MQRIFFTAILLLCILQLPAQPLLKQDFGQGGKMQLLIDDYTEVAGLLSGPGDTLLLLTYCGHADTTYYNMDVALVKMDPKGTLVSSFGNNGIARFDFHGMDYSTARQVIVCGNGDLLVLGNGYAMNDQSHVPVCIAKRHADGSPDTAFGNNGTAYLSFYGGLEFPGALQTDSAGHLLFAGGSYDTLGSHNVPVVGRYSAAAFPDSAFGGTGKQVIDFTLGLQSMRIIPTTLHLTGGEAYQVIALPGGALLVAGGYGPDCFVARLKANGTLDSAFYGTGFNVFRIEALYNNRIDKMQLLPDGTVMLGITVDKTSDRDYHLVRISPVNGAVLGSDYVDFGSNEDRIGDLALAPSGALISVGRSMTAAHALQPAYRGDWFAVNLVNDITQLSQQQHFLIAFDSLYQSGASAVAVQSDGTIVCAGFTFTAVAGECAAALLAIDPAVYTAGTMENENSPLALQVFPNPFGQFVNIVLPAYPDEQEIRISTVSGQEIFELRVRGEQEHLVDLRNFPPGIYFCRVSNGTAVHTAKLVKTE